MSDSLPPEALVIDVEFLASSLLETIVVLKGKISSARSDTGKGEVMICEWKSKSRCVSVCYRE